jgi:hypothetical protein
VLYAERHESYQLGKQYAINDFPGVTLDIHLFYNLKEEFFWFTAFIFHVIIVCLLSISIFLPFTLCFLPVRHPHFEATPEGIL